MSDTELSRMTPHRVRAPLRMPTPTLGSTMRVLGIVVLVLTACAQSPADIQKRLMARHLEARGGRQALEDLRVIERVGTITLHSIGPDAKGSYHTCLDYTGKVIVDITAEQIELHQALNDAGALECDASFQKCAIAVEPVTAGLKATLKVANREELDEHIPDPSTLDIVMDDGTPSGYKYKKEDRMVEVHFAADSGLIRTVKSGTRERRYSNWRDIGSVLLPMRLDDFNDGQRTQTIVLDEATHGNEPSQWCRERFAAKQSAAQPGVPADAPALRAGVPSRATLARRD